MTYGAFMDVLLDVPVHNELLNGLGQRRTMLAIVPDVGKPIVISSLRRELGKPLLVVCPDAENARRLFGQLLAIWGDEGGIYHFVESELLPYERISVDRSIMYQRLSTLGAIIQSNENLTSMPVNPIVVTSGLALMQKTLSPDTFASSIQTIRTGQRLVLDSLLTNLVRTGYRFGPMVEEPGMVSHRGGIVDIFTPGSSAPARIEFWGNTVDSIRLFDLDSQRSIQIIEELTLLPAAEVVPALTEGQAFREYFEALDFSKCTNEVREILDQDLNSLASGVRLDYDHLYSGFFNEGTLQQYFDDIADFVLIVDEAQEIRKVVNELESQAEKIRSTKEIRGELPLGFPPVLMPAKNTLLALEKVGVRLDLTRYHQSNSKNGLTIPYDYPPRYQSKLEQLIEDLSNLKNGRVAIVTNHSKRLKSILLEAGIKVEESNTLNQFPSPGVVSIVHGQGIDGWVLYPVSTDQEAQRLPVFTLLTDVEIFGANRRRIGRISRSSRKSRVMPAEITIGQYVVHIDHGVAKFLGAVRMNSNGTDSEYMLLQYADQDKLYVPIEQMDRMSRYRGAAGELPRLTRLSGQDWARVIDRARESVKKLAFDLLGLYAKRELSEGHAFAADSPWQIQMEDSFPFEETPDQMEAIKLVKNDMENSRPMDRLVCGDVGYGKTEIAVRAAFKSVIDNKQVAMLVPTTILAEQHYATFSERFSGFPIRIEVLSRFRTQEEQKQILSGLKNGQIDLVIGTHRLLQKDVSFKDLGLGIIDEEHRFGVGHKEILKNLNKKVDILTLTATPIPRTLHMAMAGIRDISLMETPPEHRHPIKTYLGELSDELIREAVMREMDRSGQTFYLHNRVRSIDLVANHLRELIPEATFLVAHGQMGEVELARVMTTFANGDADVLICTTIIESGLDMPSVNTLIVERADRFGLAQLYQLRGRIGRYSHRSFAYLLIEKGRRLAYSAYRRLQTILSASELGAGFQIASQDLEIRGAGNILGAEQSGHIYTIGYDLYVRLLAEAVEEIRMLGKESDGQVNFRNSERSNPLIDLGLTASIPDMWIQDLSIRLNIYQRMARIRQMNEIDELYQELSDRFGNLPEDVNNLIYVLKIRCLAREAHFESIVRSGDWITLKHSEPIGSARLVLEKALAGDVSVGHQQIHLRLNGDHNGLEDAVWQGNLTELLEQVIQFQLKAFALLDSVV